MNFANAHSFSRSKAFQSLSLEDCLDLMHDTPELTLASVSLLGRFLFTVVERDGYKEIDWHDFWEWFRTEADKPRWQGRLVNPAFHEDLKKLGIPLELWVSMVCAMDYWPEDICRIGAEYNARLKRAASSILEYANSPMVKWQASAPRHLVDGSAPADQFHVRMLWLRYRAIWSHRHQFMIDGRLFGGLRTRSKTTDALIRAVETGTDLPILRILRKPQRESYFLENPDERPAAVPSKPAKS